MGDGPEIKTETRTHRLPTTSSYAYSDRGPPVHDRAATDPTRQPAACRPEQTMPEGHTISSVGNAAQSVWRVGKSGKQGGTCSSRAGSAGVVALPARSITGAGGGGRRDKRGKRRRTTPGAYRRPWGAICRARALHLHRPINHHTTSSTHPIKAHDQLHAQSASAEPPHSSPAAA